MSEGCSRHCVDAKNIFPKFSILIKIFMDFGGYSWMVDSRISKISILDVWDIWAQTLHKVLFKISAVESSMKMMRLKIALPHIVLGLLGVLGPSLVADIRRNN